MKAIFTVLFLLFTTISAWSQQDIIKQLYDKAPELKVVDFDSTYITSMGHNDTIEYTDVNALFQNEVKDTSEYSSKWLLMAINEMDSLKAEGDFQSYLDKIDIGMLVKAGIFLVGYLDIKNGNHIVAWGVQYSTLEACPYGYGSHLFFSMVDKDFNVLNCILAAKYSGGGDPPVFGWTDRQATWNQKRATLEIHQIDVEGEMGENEDIIEKDEKDFSYRFTDEGVK